jgi:hypothetical protein
VGYRRRWGCGASLGEHRSGGTLNIANHQPKQSWFLRTVQIVTDIEDASPTNINLIYCVIEPLNHVVGPGRFCFNNSVVLVVMVPHKLKYGTSDEINSRKV